MLLSDNKVGDEWPLGARETEILKSNCADLVRFLEIDTALLARMHQNGCITVAQINYLSRKNVPEKRNFAILDILKRSSLRSYQQFINCLKHGQRNTIATRILEYDEGATLFHFSLLLPQPRRIYFRRCLSVC